ncbi:helix-turn-helix domain-containing protein [Corallococcus exiguus]|uniref:Helix-turn-helix domain-containing protein n=1 Tax=Corallococcus exiguus TaxID=83462 RepID=A0A7X5BT71_9BACT|nr:helix-turn-helix domain-containing protein [Corallococcus exiguus]NBC39887.1 helix-turn-helix domain-containing protein [Corallococcus exiguus]TNV61356.1 transposase [Corallococcus exiguus]
MSEGHPTPEKLRRAIVRDCHDEGLAYAQIAHLLGIGEATVSRVLRLYRETGDVVPRPKGGGNFSPIRGKVTIVIKRLVTQKPDATVRELMAALTARTGIVTSRPSMQRALHRLGFSHKKSPSPPASATRLITSGAGASSPRS